MPKDKGNNRYPWHSNHFKMLKNRPMCNYEYVCMVNVVLLASTIRFVRMSMSMYFKASSNPLKNLYRELFQHTLDSVLQMGEINRPK